MPNEPIEELGDIWANEAGCSLRLTKCSNGALMVEVTEGVSRPSVSVATLAPWRVQRLIQALLRAYPDVVL